MKYKVGDVVKFREDLVIGEWYGGIQFLSGMRNIRGRTNTIRHLGAGGYFSICGSVFWYSPQMLEDLSVCEPVSLDISELL